MILFAQPPFDAASDAVFCFCQETSLTFKVYAHFPQTMLHIISVSHTAKLPVLFKQHIEHTRKSVEGNPHFAHSTYPGFKQKQMGCFKHNIIKWPVRSLGTCYLLLKILKNQHTFSCSMNCFYDWRVLQYIACASDDVFSTMLESMV